MRPLELEIYKMLIKLRASGHSIDVDALARAVHEDNRDVGLPYIKDRIRLHISRLRNAPFD